VLWYYSSIILKLALLAALNAISMNARNVYQGIIEEGNMDQEADIFAHVFA